jgi:hypothetical protein
MLALAVGRVAIEHSGRPDAAMRPLVPEIDPEPAGLRLAAPRRQHRDGRVVGVQLFGRHDVLADRLDERLHQPDGLADPKGERRAVELDTLAGIDAGLAVERQVVAILADQHVREKPRTRPAALDRQRRHRRLRHRLAAPARKGRAHVADHLEAPGHVVEYLGHVLAHLAQRAAARRAGAGGLVPHLAPRQVLRQRLASGLRGFCRRRRRVHGLRRRRLVRLGFELFQHQLELRDLAIELLRRSPETLFPEPRDLDLEPFDLERLRHEPGARRLQLGGLGGDEPAQRLMSSGSGVGVELTAISNHTPGPPSAAARFAVPSHSVAVTPPARAATSAAARASRSLRAASPAAPPSDRRSRPPARAR